MYSLSHPSSHAVVVIVDDVVRSKESKTSRCVVVVVAECPTVVVADCFVGVVVVADWCVGVAGRQMYTRGFVRPFKEVLATKGPEVREMFHPLL